MINNFSSILLIFITLSCSLSKKERLSSIYFETTEYDFGSVFFKEDVSCEFKFHNTSKNSLIIEYVEISCNCTSVDWPKEKFRPKESGNIKVFIDTQNIGVFYTIILVYYNGADSPKKLLVKGNIGYPL